LHLAREVRALQGLDAHDVLAEERIERLHRLSGAQQIHELAAHLQGRRFHRRRHRFLPSPGSPRRRDADDDKLGPIYAEDCHIRVETREISGKNAPMGALPCGDLFARLYSARFHAAWVSHRASDWVPTRSSPPSARAGWVRSIARATPGSAAMWRGRASPAASPVAPGACGASRRRHAPPASPITPTPSPPPTPASPTAPPTPGLRRSTA